MPGVNLQEQQNKKEFRIANRIERFHQEKAL
jgi:hypothetical protein